MAMVLINNSTLTDIANAIRTKEGSAEKMYPREMAGKIGAIPTAEKRIIPTHLYADSNDDTNVTGKGIIFLPRGSVRLTIDGAQYTLQNEAINGSAVGVATVPIRFNNSAIITSDTPGIVGN